MKKALLIVSFGSSYKETIENTVNKIEDLFKNKFNDCDFYRAWTSPTIMRKVRAKGMDIKNVKDTLDEIAAKGYDELYVQMTHLIPGFEYNDILREVETHKDSFKNIYCGKPLMYDDKDIRDVCDILEEEYKEQFAAGEVILMGHGTAHNANSVYFKVEDELRWRGLRANIGTMDGDRGKSEVVEELVERGTERVFLAPLLLVSGVHAREDMSSDEEGSWKRVLEEKGISVDFTVKSLGEIEAIRDKYLSDFMKIVEEKGGYICE